MEVFENLQDWFSDQALTSSILKYLAWVVFIFILIAWTRKWMKKNLHDNSIKYKAQKAIQVVGYLLIILITISYFTGSIKDFGLAMGLITAGITIKLQELILSIAGSFYIFFVRVYKPGDRIEINGIKGDVIDIDSVYTTLMEMGEWVSTDNYSGRIVKISNAFVFKGPIKNYSMDFPFVWDELNILITYGSDIKIAKNLILKSASELLTEYTETSITKWKEMVARYYIEDATLKPSLAVTLTDNWIQINLRYITDYKLRRDTKHRLFEHIEKSISKTNG